VSGLCGVYRCPVCHMNASYYVLPTYQSTLLYVTFHNILTRLLHVCVGQIKRGAQRSVLIVLSIQCAADLVVSVFDCLFVCLLTVFYEPCRSVALITDDCEGCVGQ
jgi:hypothetical protein